MSCVPHSSLWDSASLPPFFRGRSIGHRLPPRSRRLLFQPQPKSFWQQPGPSLQPQCALFEQIFLFSCELLCVICLTNSKLCRIPHVVLTWAGCSLVLSLINSFINIRKHIKCIPPTWHCTKCENTKIYAFVFKDFTVSRGWGKDVNYISVLICPVTHCPISTEFCLPDSSFLGKVYQGNLILFAWPGGPPTFLQTNFL